MKKDKLVPDLHDLHKCFTMSDFEYLIPLYFYQVTHVIVIQREQSQIHTVILS